MDTSPYLHLPHILVLSALCLAGFRPRKETTTALTSVLHDWRQQLNNSTDVCTIFLDLLKAFDTVPHSAPEEDRLFVINLNVMTVDEYITWAGLD